MTKEEKQLLLQDISARLSYGVKLQCGGVLIGKIHQRYIKERCDTTLYSITEVSDNCYVINARYDLIEVKPYLRPMSSMTAEEQEELKQVALVDNEGVPGDIPAYIDWLNKNMFDYRGLIPMGLALEASEGMYKF